MPSRSLYLDGNYLVKNPAWHDEESACKAKEILRMLRRNHVFPSAVCAGAASTEIRRRSHFLGI